MSRRQRVSGLGIFSNLMAGDYNPLQRIAVIGSNVFRKVRTGKGCCGNYGDPGC